MQEIEHLERYKILLILILTLSLKAELPTNIKFAAKVYSGITNVLNENYAQAKKDFNFFKEKNSDSPLGSILYSGALIFEREHLNYYLETKEIDSLLYSAQDFCEDNLDVDPDDLWNNYLMALTKTYQTYWKLFQSNYVDGFADGFIALQYFERCLEIDSSFIEAQVVIGNYNYWSSVKTESLHWLPFIEDKRESGLKSLELALKHKFLTRDFALISLCYAYLNEERYLGAANLAETLRKKYPQSSKIKLLLAKANEKLEPQKSVQLYKELIRQYEKDNFENPYKLIELKSNLANLYYNLGRFSEANKICEDVLSMPRIDVKYQIEVLPLIQQIVELKDSTKIRLETLPKN